MWCVESTTRPARLFHGAPSFSTCVESHLVHFLPALSQARLSVESYQREGKCSWGGALHWPAVVWAKNGRQSGQLWRSIITTCSCADDPEPPGEASDGERLLQYWQSRLARSTGGEQAGPHWDGAQAQAFSSSDVRELLATAVRLRQGRVAGVLPEQVASLKSTDYCTSGFPGSAT